MSDDFKRQDYFRYKRLGKKWRRPVGWQSKLRLSKGGAGRLVSIGYGTQSQEQPTLVRNFNDLENSTKSIFIAGTVGSKKAALLAAKAKEMGLTVLNMKKIKRAKRISQAIEKNKADKKEAKKEKAAKAAEKKEHKEGEKHDHHNHEGHDHEGHKHEEKKGE